MKDDAGRKRRQGGPRRPPAGHIPMRTLLAATLRSPRHLAAIVGVVLLATIMAAPLPPAWFGPVAMTLAAIPGAVILDRVRRKVLREQQERKD